MANRPLSCSSTTNRLRKPFWPYVLVSSIRWTMPRTFDSLIVLFFVSNSRGSSCWGNGVLAPSRYNNRLLRIEKKREFEISQFGQVNFGLAGRSRGFGGSTNKLARLTKFKRIYCTRVREQKCPRKSVGAITAGAERPAPKRKSFLRKQGLFLWQPLMPKKRSIKNRTLSNC